MLLRFQIAEKSNPFGDLKMGICCSLLLFALFATPSFFILNTYVYFFWVFSRTPPKEPRTRTL